MCRIAAYFGPIARASSVVNEAPHSLEHQSHSAREMDGGTVAGDGWGLGWFPAGDRDGSPPGLIKSILPLWSDENAKTAAHAIASRSFVGHIRYASPGIEVCFTNTPLYPLGDFLFTINGELSPWPGPLSLAIRNRLHPEDEAAIRGSTDAEMLGALWRTCHRRSGANPEGIADALRETLRLAGDLAFDHGGKIKTNIIIGHAGGFVAVRYAEPGEPASLYHLAGEGRWAGASLVASEPLDDGPGWHRVEPSTLVIADRDGLRTEPIGLEPARPARSRPRASA